MSETKRPVIIYEQVRKNQIKTVLLIAFYIIIILVMSYSIGYYADNVAFGIGIGVFIVCILMPIQIFTGTKMVGSRTNWKEVDMSNPNESRVANLVEGLSIAAGIKDTPKLYIIPANIPNAFAGGLSIKNAYIGVTTGLIEILDEPEMEGVLAHEMSHIIQRDILVSTVSVYLMSAAIVLGTILYRMSRYNMVYGGRNRSRDSRDNENSAETLALIALAGMVLSYVIRFVAQIINLAISRKREYIADANAVRLCGYSEGIADALEKIQSHSREYSKEQVDDLGGDEMLGLYIFNPKHCILPLFSTHPPIEERIRILRNMY
ncbi:Protease HtpX [bioreactor metagenome]|uniref:Protease HtpX n=1 Tax=bioreactor metagenome TaxID=1076179 RepID=A0A644X6B1_9ZZZZ